MSYRSNSILYFHMPRTAGDSIRESITNFPDKCCIITHDKIRPDIFKKSVITSFTFIRNPYDRLYSAYNWIANRDVKNNEKLKEFDTREYNFLQKQNFKDFNDFASSITYDDITQDFMIHFCPMWRWISDNRTAKILIRNIFLYEDIENFKFDKFK